MDDLNTPLLSIKNPNIQKFISHMMGLAGGGVVSFDGDLSYAAILLGGMDSLKVFRSNCSFFSEHDDSEGYCDCCDGGDSPVRVSRGQNWMGQSRPDWWGHFEVEFEGKPVHIAGIPVEDMEGVQSQFFCVTKDHATGRRFISHVNKLLEKRQRALIPNYVFTDTTEGKQRPTNTWDEVVLRPGLREQIESNIASFFLAKEAYKKARVDYKRGLLFVGPPGNGKSSILKVLMSQYREQAFFIYGFTDRHDSLSVLTSILSRAAKFSPAVVVLEDIDRITSNGVFLRGMLNMMDGLDSKEGLLIIATSNNPQNIDVALIDRPSRFDLIIPFDDPDENQRRAYIENRMTEDLKLSSEEISRLVEDSKKFTMAMMQEIRTGAMLAAVGAKREVEFKDLIMSIQNLKNSKGQATTALGKPKTTAGFQLH